MKTVLDIPNVDVKALEKTYEISTIEDLFSAIESLLKVDTRADSINVRLMNGWIDGIQSKYGFNFSIYNDKSAPFYTINFKGYPRWVYFKDGVPVHFDNSACMTDTPSHECGFRSSIYETLEFDHFEKVEIGKQKKQKD